MKNEDKNFNTQLSNEEGNLNIDQISQSKNNFNNKDIIFNDSDADLNISSIWNIDNNEIKAKNSKNDLSENASIDKSLGDDFDNLNKINITNAKVNDSSIQNVQIDLNHENGNKKEKKILTKDDLNNTPIPIFECSYCTKKNKIVFQHLINKKLSEKYLLQTSIYDNNELDKLIRNIRLINKDGKNEKLLNLVIKNTEYLEIFIPKEKSIIYFKSNIFFNLCQKNKIEHLRLLKQKIEDNIVRKKQIFILKV